MKLIEYGYEAIGRDRVVDAEGNEMSWTEAMSEINQIQRAASMVLDPNTQEDIVLSPGDSGMN